MMCYATRKKNIQRFALPRPFGKGILRRSIDMVGYLSAVYPAYYLLIISKLFNVNDFQARSP